MFVFFCLFRENTYPPALTEYSRNVMRLTQLCAYKMVQKPPQKSQHIAEPKHNICISRTSVEVDVTTKPSDNQTANSHQTPNGECEKKSRVGLV